MFNLGLYFQNLGLTKTKIFLILGLKGFVIWSIMFSVHPLCFLSTLSFDCFIPLICYLSFCFNVIHLGMEQDEEELASLLPTSSQQSPSSLTPRHQVSQSKHKVNKLNVYKANNCMESCSCGLENKEGCCYSHLKCQQNRVHHSIHKSRNCQQR